MIIIIPLAPFWPIVYWNRAKVIGSEKYYFIGVSPPRYPVPMVVELSYQWWVK